MRRTHAALRAALVDLVVAQGYTAISVGDLAERAMINRATFYRHYRDKDDLLERTVASMIEELVHSFGPPRAAGESPMEGLRPWVEVLRHVAANAALYRALLGPRGSPAFGLQVRRYVEEALRQGLQAGGRRNPGATVPDEVAIAFASSAFLATVAWWLELGTPYAAEQMAAWLVQLVVLGPYRAAGWDLPHLPARP